ncbi:MAG: hypothetical protein ABI759_11380 [Candidatus Solibacter sp.]
MNEDYLWDRSGPPDLEIARLERTLAPLRYRPRAPRRSRAGWPLAAAVMAAAAALLVMVAPPPPPPTAWQVDGAQLRRGQTLRTGATPVRLEDLHVGLVDLGAHSVLRATADKRLALERGELHAFIWAPAREFVVDTPSARAIDLGCEYTLNVDERGDGVLKVSTGWVAFRAAGHEAFIPAGATCATRKRSGPGVPYFEDAPEELRRGLARLEAGETAALGEVLAAARPRDGLTVWHLLTRVSGAARGRVFDRFRELVPSAAAVSRDTAVRGDARAIDQCWNALDLQNTDWWRGWERAW